MIHGTGNRIAVAQKLSTSTRRLAVIDPETVTTAVTVAARAGVSPVANIMNNLSSLLILAAIVAVHELGHFIGARSQGIKVKNFSIGTYSIHTYIPILRTHPVFMKEPNYSPFPFSFFQTQL